MSTRTVPRARFKSWAFAGPLMAARFSQGGIVQNWLCLTQTPAMWFTKQRWNFHFFVTVCLSLSLLFLSFPFLLGNYKFESEQCPHTPWWSPFCFLCLDWFRPSCQISGTHLSILIDWLSKAKISVDCSQNSDLSNVVQKSTVGNAFDFSPDGTQVSIVSWSATYNDNGISLLSIDASNSDISLGM